MINWISCKERLPEPKFAQQYIVTVKYDGDGNINGRKTMAMTFEERGRKSIPTWCWNGRASIWEVLYWAEIPEPCQD
jgi:hypothetical protein